MSINYCLGWQWVSQPAVPRLSGHACAVVTIDNDDEAAIVAGGVVAGSSQRSTTAQDNTHTYSFTIRCLSTADVVEMADLLKQTFLIYLFAYLFKF